MTTPPTTRSISLHSRRKLQPSDASRFDNLEPGLFVDLAKTICATGVLPQKELHECWQMATHVHAKFPTIRRVADLAAGHGLLAWILVLLARHDLPSIPRTAVAVDITRPKSADILASAIATRWPDLANTVHYVEGSIDVITAENDQTLFVATHACGSLSDRVLLAAIASRCPTAIMPCCHSLRKQRATLSSLADAANLSADSLVTAPASIDQFRIDALTAIGYEVTESSINPQITKFNHIIVATPTATFARQSRPAPTTTPAPLRLGHTRAYESVHSLDVSQESESKSLSIRPSRTWRRSFDLSFWVESESVGLHLAATLESLAASPPATAAVTIRDRYIEPTTNRRAFTYRIDLTSTTTEITRTDAISLRTKLCDALTSHENIIPRSTG